MEIDQSEPPEEDEEDEDSVPQSVFRRSNNARDNTNQRQLTVARRRAGSASDTERGGNDPATRRKLGEMTKKFEKLDMKYRVLREEGIKEANANFEKLKTQSQANAKGKILLPTPLTAMLTLRSCERPNRLTEERNRDPKSAFKGFRVSRERDHLPRCRSSQDTSSSRPAIELSLGGTKREQSPASQVGQFAQCLHSCGEPRCQNAWECDERQDSRPAYHYGRQRRGGLCCASGSVEGRFVQRFDRLDNAWCGEER